VPIGTHAISNSSVESKRTLIENDVYLFKPTMKMSSYLLCFAIGPFDSLSRIIDVSDGSESRKLTVTAWGPDGSKPGLEQSLVWACNAIIYFTKTFRCFLPLEKLDLIGVPLDGLGMENFGLLTFRSTHFIIDESTPLALRKRICLLILHEVSHLWFGDMVTVKWWSYLYLKEGFARLLEYTVATILYPEYCWWDHFLTNHYGPSRLIDMNPSRTHPVEVPIMRAKDSESIFDFISYAKGASILRMSSDMMGEAFFASLPHLINTHKYHSIETNDLFECFKKSSGQDASIMSKWLKHNGHPIVTFSTTPHAILPNTMVIEISQDVHQLPGDALRLTNTCTDEEGHICYPIPLVEIKIFSPSGQTLTVNRTLFKHSDTYTIEGLPCPIDEAIVLVNASHRGYFAVNYSLAQWEKIHHAKHLFNSTEILGLLIEIHQTVNPTSEHEQALVAQAKSLENLDITTYLANRKL